jgi:2-dehydropantoate 2-reductase
MTDLVVGGGAVGSLVGWALAAGGRDVAIVRRGLETPPRPSDLTVVDSAGEGEGRTVAVTEVARPEDVSTAPELIVIAVKMFDLEAAVQSCAAWPDAVALTVSNGVGAEEIVRRVRPGAGLIAGSVTASVEPAGDRRIARLNRGGIAVAPAAGETRPLAEAITDAVATAGLRSALVADPRSMKWSKLLLNLAGNASCAVVGRPPSFVYSDRLGYEVERRQLREAFAVIRRSGLRLLPLPGGDVRLLDFATRVPSRIARPILARVIGGARGSKSPSLLLAAESGETRSEVEWLNGAVARAATDVGGVAAVNAGLSRLVSEVLTDPDRRAWFDGRLDRLAAEVGIGG